LLPEDPPDRLYAGRSGIFIEAPDAWMPRPPENLAQTSGRGLLFLPRRLPSACPLRPLPAPAGLRQSRKGNSREGNAEGNSVQSIFLKETRGKETSACPGGGQQIAENGGNERAVPIERASARSRAECASCRQRIQFTGHPTALHRQRMNATSSGDDNLCWCSGCTAHHECGNLQLSIWQ